jgi:hypothetical protein
MSDAARDGPPSFEYVERRCRVCRDPCVRRLVNAALDWRGVQIIIGPGKTHLVTYADILRDLEPFNNVRDKRDRITYDSLWVHANRHYGLAGIASYWRSGRAIRDVLDALSEKESKLPTTFL